MFRTQTNMATATYLAGVFGFALYDLLIGANWSVFGSLEYGATWPLRLFGVV